MGNGEEQIRLLQQQLEQLQTRLIRLNENAEVLNTDITSAINSSQRLNLTREWKQVTQEASLVAATIDEKTAEIERLQGRAPVPTTSPVSVSGSSVHSAGLCEEVFTSLKDLDYATQESAFAAVVNDLPPAAAFVVHGEPGCGQKWLVNRLVHACLGKQLDDVNKIPFSPHSDDTDINEFWEYLGDRLLHRRNAAPEAIIHYIFQRWQMEDIVLVIHDADRMPATEPAKMMQQLWQPLMAKLDHSESIPPYSLYLFIVDNLGVMDNWRLDCRQEPTDKDVCKPTVLPMIEALECSDIQRWVKRHRFLPNLLPRTDQLIPVAERLWNKGRRGVPESTMKAVCDRIAPERHLWYDIVHFLDL
ncbi:MAG: hypothetical protein AAFY20_19880 [Cyanobacteria bacterium J06639_14]